jgi:hypothetical protein
MMQFSEDVLLNIACWLEPFHPSMGNKTRCINKQFASVSKQNRRQGLKEHAQHMISRATRSLLSGSCHCRLMIVPLPGMGRCCNVCGPIEILAMFADCISGRFREFLSMSSDGKFIMPRSFVIRASGPGNPCLSVTLGVPGKPIEFIVCRIGNLSFKKVVSSKKVVESLAGQLRFFHTAVHNAMVARTTDTFGRPVRPCPSDLDDAGRCMWLYFMMSWPKVCRQIQQPSLVSNGWYVHQRGDLYNINHACRRLKRVDSQNIFSICHGHARCITLRGVACFTV